MEVHPPPHHPSTPPHRLKQQHQSLRGRSSDQSLADSPNQTNMVSYCKLLVYHPSGVHIGFSDEAQKEKSAALHFSWCTIQDFILHTRGGGGRGRRFRSPPILHSLSPVCSHPFLYTLLPHSLPSRASPPSVPPSPPGNRA
jgi:hypothetical protein